MLRLDHAGSVLELAPEIGGGVARLMLAGHEILRPTSPRAIIAGSPLGLSEFPMAPWVNRVAAGKFGLDGLDNPRHR